VSDLVRIHRRDQLDDIDGLLQLGAEDFYIIRPLSESLDLDGVALVRRADIVSVDECFERSDFYRAALTAWPDRASDLQWAGRFSGRLQDDFRVLTSEKCLIAVHTEIADPDIAFVGTVLTLEQDAILLQLTTSAGIVEEAKFKIFLADITKIEVNTRYLTSVEHGCKILAEK